MNLASLQKLQTNQKQLLTDTDRDVFLQESIDLFTHQRQGHLIHRCYLTPEALYLGGKWSSRPESYMKRGEIYAIKSNVSAISHLARNFFGVIGIENGPGMPSAIRDKSIPFFSQLTGLHTWVGRDLSPASINIMKDVMGRDLPNIRIIPDMSDFQKTDFPNDLWLGRKVLAEFGMTRGNMEGFPEDGFPYHVIKQDLLSHRSRLNEGDIYTFTFDSNQNGSEIERAYNSEYTTLWGRELFRAMQSELPINGDFDPHSYNFKNEWVASSHGGFNYMIAQRRMQFEIAGIPITIEKGDGWGITNSFKMPLDIVKSLANETGYRIKLNLSNDTKIAMPALIAI